MIINDHTILSIEIGDKTLHYAFLSEQISDKNTTERDILVRELGTFPIPPKVMDRGRLINPEVLSREILLLINQVNPHLQQLIITLTDVCGVKRVERIPALVLVQGDREIEIESRLSRSPLLSGQSFYSSFHMPLSALREGDKTPPVFFTGVRKEIYDDLEGMIPLKECQLVGVDWACLSILRAMLWGKDNDNPELFMIIEANSIEFFVCHHHHIIFTQGVYRNIAEDIDDKPVLGAMLSDALTHFLLAYSNAYPASFSEGPSHRNTLTHVMVYSRFFDAKAYEEILQNRYRKMVIESYTPHFKTEAKVVEKQEDLLSYVPAIGAGLAFYEQKSPIISLRPLRKPISDFFNIDALKRHAAVWLVVVALMFYWSWFQNYARGVHETRTVEIKKELDVLSKQDKGQQMAVLDKMTEKIDFFTKVDAQRENALAVFDLLLKKLPEDMVFDDCKISDNGRVVLKGRTFLQDSIQEYMSYLEDYVDELTLHDVSMNYDGEVPVNLFSLTFMRRASE